MNTPLATRRRALQLLAGAPLLPMTSGAALMSLAASAQAAPHDHERHASAVRSVSFSHMPAPTLADPGAMASVSVGSVMTVEFRNRSRAEFKLAYQPFFITGDAVPGTQGTQVLAGGYYDINNRPIMDNTVPDKARQFFSDSPDGTSLLSVRGAPAHTVFAVVQFEYTSKAQDGTTDMYGKLPSPIAVLTLRQDPHNGKLSLLKYHNVDTSSVHGLWITCGASLSPWGTHLSSEEYEPDAFAARNEAQFKAFSLNLFGSETTANPYHYGHLPEVTVRPDGTASIRKHYCMGRISHELVQVMPDLRTVLMGDDATNAGYFVFVADRERDLSSGTLYAARLTGNLTTLEPGATPIGLSWIKLGSASSQEVLAMADSLQPAQIMDVRSSDPVDASFTKIWVNGKVEWVKLKPGMEKAAAFLETHRYAALLGASLAFTKMEGTTVNTRDKVAYSALSYAYKSMLAGDKTQNPTGGVALPKAINAGAVMALKLRGKVNDAQGARIRSEWMPASIETLLTGEDMPKDALGNTAVVERIANPDNLKFSEQLRTLFIGEDSGMHVNNFLWAYQVDTGTLSRIMSVPVGAESTGLHAVDELNGWTYIMSNFQHAGDWKGMPPEVEARIDANFKNKFGAAVGYLTSELTQLRAG